MSRPRPPVHDCRYHYSNNVYIVRVTILQNNTPLSLQMVLDTGASFVSAPDDVFDALELVAIRTLSMQTPSGAYRSRIALVEKIILDDVVTVPSVEIASTPRNMGTLGGLLGGSFLKEVGIYLDPRKNLLRFHHDG